MNDGKETRTARAATAQQSAFRLTPEIAGTIFNGGIAPRLVELKKKYLAQKRLFDLTWVVSIAITLVVGGMLMVLIDVLNGILLALLIGAGTHWSLGRRPRRDFRLSLRQEIFKPLCDAAGISYSLAPMRSNAKSFADFGLVSGFDASRFENQLAGTYKGIVFLQTDACLLKKNEENTTIAFKGVLTVFELKKNFRGQTVIVKDSKHLEQVIEGFQQRPERIGIDNWAFEQRFEVYASDEPEARTILSPAFMGQLLGLEQNLGFSIQLAFAGSSMLMALDLTEDAIEIADLELPFADPRRLTAAMIRFESIFETIDVLQLGLQAKPKTWP